MNWIAADVHFSSDNPEQIEDLVSNIFYEFGLQGVVVADACVTGYFPLDDRIDHHRRQLESALLKLKQAIRFDYRVDYSETTEEDWAESWKAFFKPQRIGRRLIVKPGGAAAVRIFSNFRGLLCCNQTRPSVMERRVFDSVGYYSFRDSMQWKSVRGNFRPYRRWYTLSPNAIIPDPWSPAGRTNN